MRKIIVHTQNQLLQKPHNMTIAQDLGPDHLKVVNAKISDLRTVLHLTKFHQNRVKKEKSLDNGTFLNSLFPFLLINFLMIWALTCKKR